MCNPGGPGPARARVAPKKPTSSKVITRNPDPPDQPLLPQSVQKRVQKGMENHENYGE
jgi:hypothetical protein